MLLTSRHTDRIGRFSTKEQSKHFHGDETVSDDSEHSSFPLVDQSRSTPRSHRARLRRLSTRLPHRFTENSFTVSNAVECGFSLGQRWRSSSSSDQRDEYNRICRSVKCRSQLRYGLGSCYKVTNHRFSFVQNDSRNGAIISCNTNYAVSLSDRGRMETCAEFESDQKQQFGLHWLCQLIYPCREISTEQLKSKK